MTTNRPAKVLHVETGPHLYGGALQVFYLLGGLQKAGWQNILVCTKGSDIARAAHGVVDRVYEAPMSGDLDVAFVSRLRRIIKEERPDLVHLHSRRGADLLGGIAARLSSVPVILTRRVDNPEPKWWVALKYRLYDQIVTISEGIRAVLVSEGVPAHRIECVHSAVDIERYKPNCDLQWFRNEFGLSEENKAVGMIAQLILRKGHRYVFEAIPAICETHPETRFLLFGKGPLEQELKEQCQRHGLEKYVQFVGFRDDLDRVLPCLNVVAHPADMEGLGVSLLQASACGVPIVATPAGGIPEIVRDGENGYLVPKADVNGIADRLAQLLSDEALAARMGQAGREIVEQNFSVKAMVDGNIRVYQGLLGH